jgi:hypothetical protein
MNDLDQQDASLLQLSKVRFYGFESLPHRQQILTFAFLAAFFRRYCTLCRVSDASSVSHCTSTRGLFKCLASRSADVSRIVNGT